jgi:hypothetical protein
MSGKKELVLIIEPYNSLPCSLETFTINGMDADESDFGSTVDMDSENAEQYGCGDRQFAPEMPTDEVLEKYSINLKDYKEVCNGLQNALAVGNCGWCI